MGIQRSYHLLSKPNPPVKTIPSHCSFLAAILLCFPSLLSSEEITLSPIMDASVSEAEPERNYGTSDLAVGQSSGQAWESFLRFDLSGIPVTAEITAAELRLKSVDFGGGGTLRISKPDAGWAEIEVDWANRPSGTLLDDIALTLADQTSAHLSLTESVLQHLNDVVSSVTPDRGIKLSFPDAGAEENLSFQQRESETPPQLVLTYTPGPEVPDFTANLAVFDTGFRAKLFRAPEGAPVPLELVWNTRPGVRYRLWESENLRDWSVVPGYPLEADGLGALHEVSIDPAGKFFQVEPLDEQPPQIVSRFPDEGDFGIRRFYEAEELGIQLSDLSGIDPASISLDLGVVGTFSVSDSELTLDESDLLTLDLGADTALGAFGEVVEASLTVADPLGNSRTFQWSFELEKEVVLADNLFTFGSPDAQRAGQRVPPIPTRMLADRLGGGGPVRADDHEWTLDTVNPDSVVISYSSAAAPIFEVDQYLTNLTPATVDEIFYRKVTAITDDPEAGLLTLTTAAVPLWEVMEAGTLRLSPGDVAFEVDEDGRIIRATALRAISASAALELDPLEVDWGGQKVLGTYTKADNTAGFRFDLPIDEKAPDGSDWDGTLHLDQAYFKLSPALELSADLSLFQGITAFTVEPSIRVDAGLEPRYEFLSASISADYEPEQPLFKADFRIPIGSTPAWVTFSPQLKTKAEISAGLTGSISAGASGGYETSLLIDYQKSGDPVLSVQPGDTDYNFDLIPPEILVGGTAGASFSLVPELDVKLVDAVGFYVNLDPTVRLDATASLSNQSLVQADLTLGFDVNLNAGLSVVGVDQGDLPAIDPWELFTWEKSWVFPKAPPEAPLEILVQPQSQTVSPGANVTLEVQANHTDGVSYEWRQNGRRLPVNSPILRLTSVTAGSGGDYQVTLRRAGSEQVVSEVAFLEIESNVGLANPLVHLRFEDSGEDSSGNNYHSTPIGRHSYVDGVNGKAIKVYGDGQLFYSGGGHVALPRFDLSGLDGFTISLWSDVSAHLHHHSEALATFGINGSEAGIFVRRERGNPSRLEWIGFPPGVTYFLEEGSLLDGWHHYALVYDKGNLHGYLDGELVASASGIQYGNTSGQAALGRHWWHNGASSSARLEASFDEFRLYDRALSPSQIDALSRR